MKYKCPSCGKRWEDHDGIHRTCKKLQAIRKFIAAMADPANAWPKDVREMCRFIVDETK